MHLKIQLQMRKLDVFLSLALWLLIAGFYFLVVRGIFGNLAKDVAQQKFDANCIIGVILASLAVVSILYYCYRLKNIDHSYYDYYNGGGGSNCELALLPTPPKDTEIDNEYFQKAA